MTAENPDPILALMIENNVPLTREDYLTLMFMGDPPEWSAELEGEIPEQFQDWKARSFGPSGHKAKLQGHHARQASPEKKKHGFYNLSEEEIEELGNRT